MKWPKHDVPSAQVLILIIYTENNSLYIFTAFYLYLIVKAG